MTARYLFAICALLLPFTCFSQEVTKELNDLDFFSRTGSQKQGYGIIKADPQIEGLLQRHIAVNMKQKGIVGWRVQIFLGSGRDASKNAQTVKAQFVSAFPDTEVYLDYQAPYFRVRVGNFRKTDKHLAMKLKKELTPSFSSLWIVEDLIDYQKL